METEAIMIEITDGSARLTIEVARRSYPGGDYWSRNYVVTQITANLPGFRVDFTEEMHLEELEHLGSGLKRLYANLSGAAEFQSSEGFLRIRAEVDRRGHVAWAIEIVHPVGSGNETCLCFCLDADQSYLPPLLAQIEAVQEQFPLE